MTSGNSVRRGTAAVVAPAQGRGMAGATFGGTPWMTTRQAMEYTHRPTLAAFRMFARRRGLVSSGRLWDRRDIDAALRVSSVGHRRQQPFLAQQLNQLSNRQR